jgi:hypothetical protein
MGRYQKAKNPVEKIVNDKRKGIKSGLRLLDFFENTEIFLLNIF